MRQFLAFFLLFLAASAQAGCSRVLRSAWAHWPPYAMANSLGQPIGLDIELLQRVALEAGCQVQFSAGIPPQRQLSLVRSGAQDIQFAASVRPEREVFAWFSPAYRNETMSMMVRQASIKHVDVTDVAQLAERDVAVIAPFSGWYGPHYAEVLPKLETSGRLRHYKNTEQGLELLNTQRGDVLIGDLYSFLYVAKQQKTPLPQTVGQPLNDDVVHYMYSKKSMHPQDVSALNDAIDRLKVNGELKKITDRYAGQTGGRGFLN